MFPRALTSLFFAYLQKNSHKEHAQRFLDPSKTNYADSHHKALLIIGSKKGQVKERVNAVAEFTKDEKDAPEIVGVVVSLTHDSYQMYLPDKDDAILFICDRVAKCLRIDGHGRLSSVQSFSVE